MCFHENKSNQNTFGETPGCLIVVLKLKNNFSNGHGLAFRKLTGLSDHREDNRHGKSASLTLGRQYN